MIEMHNLESTMSYIRYEGNRIVVDPAKLWKRLKTIRKVIFTAPVFSVLIVVMLYFRLSTQSGSHIWTPSFLVFIVLMVILPTPLIFLATSWIFPRTFDPIAQKMTIHIPLFKKVYDIAAVDRVVVESYERAGRYGKSVVVLAKAQTQAGKSIEIMRGFDIPIDSFREVVKQLCSAMGWQYVEGKMVQQ